MALESSPKPQKTVEDRERVIVRFAGDSGDGMQLAGTRFTDATAMFGNDLATLPDFPAEIRAPAGTVGGVSAFQIHFAARDILTPGRHAERPGRHEPGGAARPTCALLERGATIIVNEDAFTRPRAAEGRLRATPTRSRTARSTPSRSSASR